ncbi:MAG: hypothetical protein Q8O55_10070 [Dehalococcoidales bacterium]|nr:hypothetical protein [Dehalococcoidales bacterium]
MVKYFLCLSLILAIAPALLSCGGEPGTPTTPSVDAGRSVPAELFPLPRS